MLDGSLHETRGIGLHLLMKIEFKEEFMKNSTIDENIPSKKAT